jgi:hypothetical protein
LGQEEVKAEVMADTADLPKLGGRLKDIKRTPQRPKMEVPRTKPPSRLGKLAKAEKAIAKSGKSQVARVLGTRLGARLLPALAVALAAKDVYAASREGVNAYVAHKDLARTREHMQKRYGNVQRASATRKALTKRR